MNNPNRPPLQSQIDFIWGSPEGVEDGQVGRLVADGKFGRIYRKTTDLGIKTGWVEVGGSSTATGIYAPSTYAETRALPMTPTPVAAFVQGDQVSGDGGRGIYLWVATSEAPDDGYSSIALTANGSNPGRFIRFFN